MRSRTRAESNEALGRSPAAPMQKGRSSNTAAYVAMLRALGDRGITSARGFHDDAARVLLPPAWARGLAWALPAIPALPAQARKRVIAHVDVLVLRALAIDTELDAALARVNERTDSVQVVILGAGFDSRAYRMTALEGANVFEVDHPATQFEKQRRAAGLARTCRKLTYVACDFERDVLAERLASAGHREDEPTIWIWEGVTLYLDDAALRSTLATIAARSAPLSTLIVEYHDKERWDVLSLYSFVRKILLAFWSEPQIGQRTQQAMHADLERAGLHIDKDFGVADWGVSFAGASARQSTGSARLAIATT